MKKIISALLVIVFCFCFASCKKKTEVSRKAIDKQFTAAHIEKEVFFITVCTGKSIIMIPNYVDKQVPDKYEILYLITYDDEKQKEKWFEVTQAEFESTVIE